MPYNEPEAEEARAKYPIGTRVYIEFDVTRYHDDGIVLEPTGPVDAECFVPWEGATSYYPPLINAQPGVQALRWVDNVLAIASTLSDTWEGMSQNERDVLPSEFVEAMKSLVLHRDFDH